MKATWQTAPERGSNGLTHFITWLSLSVSRTMGRLLLYPICVYFVASSGNARRASRKYLTRVFGNPATLSQVYQHYLAFSRVLLDRVFFLSGRLDEFDVTFSGSEIIDEQLKKNRGCLFLGAHIGSFEVLRTFGIIKQKIPIKVLIYPDNSRQILSLMDGLNPALAQEMIPLGKPNTMLLAKQHLDQGGVIGLLGDRIAKGDKTIRTTFLGEPANLPAGPILLASLLKIPVILFSGLYRGDARYECHFELFAEEITLDRETRQQDLQIWADRYAAALDETCKNAPYNWFNFYDFWDLSDDRS